jgi:hypothetical protein
MALETDMVTFNELWYYSGTVAHSIDIIAAATCDLIIMWLNASSETGSFAHNHMPYYILV